MRRRLAGMGSVIAIAFGMVLAMAIVGTMVSAVAIPFLAGGGSGFDAPDPAELAVVSGEFRALLTPDEFASVVTFTDDSSEDWWLTADDVDRSHVIEKLAKDTDWYVVEEAGSFVRYRNPEANPPLGLDIRGGDSQTEATIYTTD